MIDLRSDTVTQPAAAMRAALMAAPPCTAGLLPFLKERGMLAAGACASRSPGLPKSDAAPSGGWPVATDRGPAIRQRFVTPPDVDVAGVGHAIAAVRDYFKA